MNTSTNSINLIPILPVFNEESRIAATLDYYKTFFARILVVDNNSVDSTQVIALKYSNIEYIQKPNNGTTESQDWFDWITSNYPSDYYLLLSCSERLSPMFINKIPLFIQKGYDLVYTNRRSMTGGVDTSIVYTTLLSLFSPHPTLTHAVCRFCSLRAIMAAPIEIHTNFGPAKPLVNTFTNLEQKFSIIHLRESSPHLAFTKHLAYAQIQAQFIANPNSYIVKWLAREVAFILILFVRGSLNRVIYRELILRIVMHLQIYTLSIESHPSPD